MSGRWVVLWLASATAATAGCERAAARSEGQLEAAWTRGDTGQFSAAATAEWCAAGRYVEIKAMRGDTGVAVAIFPADTAPASLPGRYRLRDTLTDSLRPGAAVALRWAEVNSVAGFRSDSGVVVLRRGADGRLAGELKVAGRLIGGLPRRLAVAGRFHDVVVAPASPACPRLLEQPRDSSVHFPHGNPVPNRIPPDVKRLPPGADLLPQGLWPQRGRGGPPQRGLPQRSGGGAPRP